MTDVPVVWADMSYCLNPVCPHPHNPSAVQTCQSCGRPLLLAQRYRMGQPIGSGGFSRTFLATDCTTGQACVVKQCLPVRSNNPTVAGDRPSPIRPAFDREALQRFRQEAQRLGELGDHPQIPRLVETIEQPVGPVPALYLVQEWIEGQNLAVELVQSGPWNEEKGRSLLAELLPVLQFIHDRQVIHRDIKPENIIRSMTDETLVLVDFGAAKQTSRSQMAQTGTIIGSAGYAAPEQTMGKATFASDIYSLGVTCLHLLTGLHPFDLYAVSQDDWVWSQYITVPLSETFSTILTRMVCRSVNQRYRNVAAVLTDLNALTPLSLPSPPVNQPSPVAQNPFLRLIQRVPLPLLPNATDASPPPWLAFERSPHRPPPLNPSSLDVTADSSRTVASIPTNFSDRHFYALAHTLIHPQSITTLTINADGTLLASGSNQGTITLWHLPSATRWHEFSAQTLWQRGGHRDRITALQFSPDGATLFSSSADSTIKQWDVLQPRLLQTLTGEGWGISTLVLHPDGALLLSGGTNGAIDLWNVKQGNVRQGSVRQGNVQEGQFIQRLWLHTDAVTSLTIAADGAVLWSSSADGRVYGWDLRTAEAIASIPAHYNGVLALVCHPQAGLMVTSGGDRTLRFWDMSSLRLLRTVEIHLEQGTPMALHPNGRWLVTAQDETHLQLWRLQFDPSRSVSLTPRYSLSQDWTLSDVVFSPVGDRLVSGSSDGTIKIWQPQRESR